MAAVMRVSTSSGVDNWGAKPPSSPSPVLCPPAAGRGRAQHRAGRRGRVRPPVGHPRGGAHPHHGRHRRRRLRRRVQCDRPPVRPSGVAGVGEQDEEGWIALTARLGERIQLVGDDNFVTNPEIITAAIGKGIGNAALIKLNQIGTVTETLAAMAVCRDAGYGRMVSHRSGETEDTFIADLAVGTGCGQLKTGAPARGERVAKYNRLIEIEAHSPDLGYGIPTG